MLDAFSADEKAAILASIMMDELNGVPMRDACRAQGITLQTAISWKEQARKRNRAEGASARPEAVHNGPRKPRREPPPTAMALAMQAAQRAAHEGLPADNPEDIAAIEADEAPFRNGSPAPSPEPANAEIASPPAEAASGPESAPAEPDSPPGKPEKTKTTLSQPVKDSSVAAKSPQKKSAGKPRGIGAVIRDRLPWLAGVEAKTARELGPKPGSSEAGYHAWIKRRKELMSPEQAKEIEALFGIRDRAAKGEARKAALTNKRAEIAAGIVPDPIEASAPAAANGAAAPKRKPPKASRKAAHVDAHIAAQVASAPPEMAAPLPALVSPPAPRENHLHAEISTLRAALAALTIENLRLRGLI